MRELIGSRAFAAVLGLTGIACQHTVDPKVTPEKLVTVRPALEARALLALRPEFENYTSDASSGLHRYVTHLGASGSRAMQDMITGSFQHTEVLHVSDIELLHLLSAPADSGNADLLLVPDITVGDTRARFADFKADVTVRLEVRNFRSGATYSWSATGHATRVFGTAWSGMTGDALVGAINALADTLKANRGKLEVARAP